MHRVSSWLNNHRLICRTNNSLLRLNLQTLISRLNEIDLLTFFKVKGFHKQICTCYCFQDKIIHCQSSFNLIFVIFRHHSLNTIPFFYCLRIFNFLGNLLSCLKISLFLKTLCLGISMLSCLIFTTGNQQIEINRV